MQFHTGDADEHLCKEDVEMELPSMVRKTWLNTRVVTDLVEGIIVLPKLISPQWFSIYGQSTKFSINWQFIENFRFCRECCGLSRISENCRELLIIIENNDNSAN